MNKVYKPSDSEYCTSSSEFFKFYWINPAQSRDRWLLSHVTGDEITDFVRFWELLDLLRDSIIIKMVPVS
jgi:hypothetical protein